MRLTPPGTVLRTGWPFALCSLLVLSLAAPAMAQRGGGGTGGGGGLGRPPRQDDPGKGGPHDDRPVGSEYGRIMKLTPPKEGENEDIQSYLTFKPPGKAAPITVRILRNEPPVIELGDRKDFEPEELPEILTKGLFCRFSWKLEKEEGDSKKKRKKNKDLSGVTFDGLEVSGKIDEIKEDMVILRCKPKNDRPWPDAVVVDKPTSGITIAKPKKVPVRKLKLKIVEDATKFLDADNKALDPSDFEASQTVDALVVYGRGGGIALNLKSPTLRSEGGGDDRDSGGGRGGRGGGPTPPSQ